MIWYLLYPFRGTTEVPTLSVTHPLRSAFTRFGRYAAQHVVTTLLISVAVAATLIYPFPFLYSSDFTNAASNLPHHVWTDAQPLGDGITAEPDVIMRQIWVHGSYMRALERDVLLGALELQDQLLGPTRNFNPRRPRTDERPSGSGSGSDLSPDLRDSFHVVNGLTNSSWFFHSPLLYWSCSSDNILADSDIVFTVNEKKTQPTSVKVTLRHSIVFSGKRFQDRRLVSADALVITLIHLRDSPVGKQWVRKAEELAGRMGEQWMIIPKDGRSMPSQLYEFQFRPISVQDSAFLTLAYSITLLYFLFSLSKLQAVKSKFGLILTLLTQIVVSVIASFTVCAVFKIDLSRIPYFAHPFAILAISMENSFRLINAVLMTPADHTISSRIGYAFGETAHVAVASRAQNLVILWVLSKITFPGVAAFCTFAAIAIVLDFFFLSTFFLSVLSIEIQRTELSDALEKVSAKHSRQPSRGPSRQSLTDAIFQGKIALSTRIAGTVVLLGFVLMAQWHFFDNDHVFQTLGQLFNISRKSSSSTDSRPSLLVDIHQARSPTSWLRLQDHETAREVIKVVKPDAHSYIARVYDPLVFVLKGSDRMPHTRERLFLPAVYDFMNHQSLPFVVTVLVIMAAVRLLMSYLLWDKVAESTGEGEPPDEPLLSGKVLKLGHALDVAMMASSADGRLVTVGLDRLICVWDIRSGVRHYRLPDPTKPTESPFPVLAMAIDQDSRWLALLSWNQVLLWDMAERKWGPAIPVDLFRHKPESFFFGSRKRESSYSIVLVRHDGAMTELQPDIAESTDYVVCKGPLICAVSLDEKNAAAPSQANPVLSILTVSRRSCMHLVTQHETRWISECIKFSHGEQKDVQSIVALAGYSAYMVVRSRTIDLVDLHSSEVIHTFITDRIRPRSLEYLHSARRSPQSASVGLGSLTLAYVSAETGDCVLQTYVPREEGGGPICLCRPSQPDSGACCPWRRTREIRRIIPNPGSWEALPTGCIVGVRKKTVESDDHTVKSGSTLVHKREGGSGLRRRRPGDIHADPQPRKKLSSTWEAWAICQLDKPDSYVYETYDLVTEASGEGGMIGVGDVSGQLMISELGPMARVGSGSVAVALGNVVRVLTVGHERFDVSSAADNLAAEGLASLSTRRRKAMSLARQRVSA